MVFEWAGSPYEECWDLCPDTALGSQVPGHTKSAESMKHNDTGNEVSLGGSDEWCREAWIEEGQRHPVRR